MIKKITFSLLTLFAVAATAQKNALEFDGTDDYIQATNPGPIDSTSRTVEAWINMTSATAGKYAIIVDWGDMANGHRFTFNVTQGKLRIEIGGYGLMAPTAMTANAWHHVATTYSRSGNPKVRLYVDGAEVANGNFTLPMVTSNLNGIIIGRRNDSINYFGGKIDEVRVWNVDRTAADIATNMNTEFCSTQPGLVAYYNFNQGVAGGANPSITALTDLSGSNNNGVLNNFASSGTGSNFVAGAPVTSVNTNITQSWGTLSSDAISGNYQWLDCNNNKSAIVGATSKTFYPSAVGDYAVMVSENWCVDTSACVNMTTVSVDEVNSDKNNFSLYPNPIVNNGVIYISTKNPTRYSIKVVDVNGNIVYSKNYSSDSNATIDLKEQSAGIYVFEITTSQNVVIEKIVKY